MPDRPNSLHVGVLGGTRLPGNVRTFLENLRQLLWDAPIDFQCDLVLNGDVETVTGYRQVDPGMGGYGRAAVLLRRVTTAMTTYAHNNNPDVLLQVTKFPLHGFATTVAGNEQGSPFRRD